MRARWQVIDDTTGRNIETHDRPLDAMRALMILSAHEVKNGRVADFRIEPPITISYKLEELSLPRWVLEIFES